jgi:4-alpha-glucanotransferase
MEETVGLLKALDILKPEFNWQTQDKDEQARNLSLIRMLIKEKKDANFINIVHHIPILRQNKVDWVEISLPDDVKSLKWNFYEDEDLKKYYKGEVAVDAEKSYSGEIRVEELERLPETPETRREINGKTYHKYRFKFPFDVRYGYHTTEFSYEQKGVEVMQRTHLISAPEKCYDRLGVDEGKKTWGVPVQLYEQRSENNLGIGNFSDLAELGYVLGKNGAGILGVNPLHATRDDQPENASPYGPDSRMFFNYIYVDVTAVDEFKNSKAIRDYYNSDEVQKEITQNRRRSLVNYSKTQQLVDDILHRCFDEFKYSSESAERRDRFRVYCDDKGEDLDKFALFHALNKHFSSMDPAPMSWKEWPEEYQNVNSPEVQAFYQKNKGEIDYYKYTQWVCETQLQQVKETCRNSGMKIGLYQDMAVGVLEDGFESWYYSDLFVKGSAGAEPDVLSQKGQKWNLLGFNPEKLQERGYEPYRKMLEANMRYAGCLRIDHVLQLNRLFIYPEGSEKGSYIYYNRDELMAVVALESHRHKTMIVGEDLGNTTEDFRSKMDEFGILSYKVLPFERKNDMYLSMRRPEEYPVRSVCAPSTHDTPTLVNQWNVQHVYQQHFLGVINDRQADEKFEQYASQREGLNWLLEHEGIWKEVGGKRVEHPREDANNVPDKYVQAVTTLMARSNSAIMLMPFSDIFGMSEMGNIPGVSEMAWHLDDNPLVKMRDDKSYPNWRKKMHIPVEHVADVKKFKEVAAILNKYRPDGNDGRGRYYQFERMGNNEPSSLDFEHAQKIYDIICRKEDYRFSTLLQNRYSQKYKNRIERKHQSAKDRYENSLKAWKSYRNRVGKNT